MDTNKNKPSIDAYLYGYIYIELLHLCEKHRIFQYLIDNHGHDIQCMADALKLNPDALARILISLGAANIIIKKNNVYHLNPDYQHFVDRNSDGFMGHYIQFIHQHGRAALQQLEGHLTNKTQSESPYDTLYDSEEGTSDFAEAMWELSYSTGKELATYMPDDCGSLVDLGGGGGAMAVVFEQTNICDHITVFDLPAVESDFQKKMNEYGLSDKIDFFAGDFFVDKLPQAQTYVLSYVLSNWDEDKIIALLKRIGEIIEPNKGRLIVLERLFDEDGIKPFSTAVMHLNMMLQTQGRHRTEIDYRRLFFAAGFSSMSVIHTPIDKQILIATKRP